MTATDEELIRHRIEKRLSGRRDLILHLLVYLLVTALVWISMPLRARALFGVMWVIPLALNALRYFYQYGPGLRKRAEAIDRELDRYSELTALDEDEELLIEDRVIKKFTARRFIAGHLIVMVGVLGVIWANRIDYGSGFYYTQDLVTMTQIWGGAFLLHWQHFFFVHGLGPAGRALKIEKEVERQWHLSRDRRRERREIFDAADDEIAATVDLDRVREGQSLVTDDGELIDDRVLLEAAGSAQAGTRGDSQ